jgi:hypothetical protein
MPIAFTKFRKLKKKRGEIIGRERGYMEVCFSTKDLYKAPYFDPGYGGPNFRFLKGQRKTSSLDPYADYHIYGYENKYLIPLQVEAVDIPDRYEEGDRWGIDQIKNNPTTATYREVISFLPCGPDNLGKLVETLQSLPFVIETGKDIWLLHIKDSKGRYRTLFSQRFCPPCWDGRLWPVICVHKEIENRINTRYVLFLKDIQWGSIFGVAEDRGWNPSSV